MMWNWDGYGWSGFGAGWWFVHALFWIVVIWIVIRFLRGPFRNGGGDRSVRILRERYAKGELSREEFERMKSDLGAS